MSGWSPSAIFKGVAIAVAVVAPACLPAFLLFEISIAMSYGIAVLGLNMLMGFAGQICLAQGALFGFGAYVAAILNATYGIAPLATLPFAAVLTAVAGLLVGLPALRLQGLQLAIITFGVAAAFPQLLLKLGWLTGGVSGLPVDPLDAPALLQDNPALWPYLVTVVCGAAAIAVAKLALCGGVGRAMRAQRDNPLIAVAFGVNLTRIRLGTFALSSALAGLGGGVFALLNGFVTPQSFLAPLSINIVIGSIIGGSTSTVGAIVGGLFIVFVPKWASQLNLALGDIIYGVALISVMMMARDGVTGLFTKLFAAVRPILGATPSP
jgi:branched-chain amino acid transport system permease protein